MSPTRSRYKDLGLDPVEPLQDQPHKPRRPPMADKKKDEGAGYLIKILLEESLEKHRNAMMDNFSQILQWMPTRDASSSGNHYGGATPFKVQVNFDIPTFEGQIDADVVEKWLIYWKNIFLFVIFPLHLCIYGYIFILWYSYINPDQWYQISLLFLDPSWHVPNEFEV